MIEPSELPNFLIYNDLSKFITIKLYKCFYIKNVTSKKGFYEIFLNGTMPINAIFNEKDYVLTNKPQNIDIKTLVDMITTA